MNSTLLRNDALKACLYLDSHDLVAIKERSLEGSLNSRQDDIVQPEEEEKKGGNRSDSDSKSVASSQAL